MRLPANRMRFPPRLAALVERACENSGIGVQVGVSLGASASLLRSSALLRAPESPAVFKCASQAKPVVAVCAVRLAQAGRLDLDEPVTAVVPQWPEQARIERRAGAWVSGVTLRRLLSHTAGFTTRGFPQAMVDGPTITPEMILAGHFGPEHECGLHYPPGEGCVYSGAGFVLAQLAIEARLGAGVGEICREQVFEPLQMCSSRLGWSPGSPLPEWPLPGPATAFPAIASSGLFSTMEDLAKLWRAVGQPDPAFLSLCWSGELVRVHGTAENGFSFGLGFAVASNGSRTVFKHAGWCDEAWVAAEGVVGLPLGVAVAARTGGEEGKDAVLPVASRVTEFVLAHPRIGRTGPESLSATT